MALVALPGTAAGAPLLTPARAPVVNPLLLPIKASQCVIMEKRSGRDVLVNRCGECRVVQVKRKRPGSKPASIRDLTLAGKSETPLSFRGPGRTRIASDISCAQDRKSKDAPEKPKVTAKQCLRLHFQKGVGMVMVNACDTCRKAVVERIYDRGRRNMVNIAVGANFYVKVPAEGASQARIVNEKSCN